MKKKLVSLLLAMVMATQMVSPAMAATEPIPQPESQTGNVEIADSEQSNSVPTTEKETDTPPADPALYTVTAEGASAEPAQAAQGTKVVLTAKVPEGQTFDKWEATEGVEIIDGSFAMPAQDVQVKAVFKQAEAETQDEAETVTTVMSVPVALSAGNVHEVTQKSKEWTTGTWEVNQNIDRIWKGDNQAAGFARVEVKGDVTLVLNANLTIPEGIHVGTGNSLTIKGTGTLISGPKEYAAQQQHPSYAGIGGNPNEDAGTIKIESGTVIAYGYAGGGAGIGGGGFSSDSLPNPNAGNGGNITIIGGNVTARGRLGGAGIGSGASASGKDKTVSGGTIKISRAKIKAEAVDGGAAIGGGNGSDSGNITISGNADVTVTANRDMGIGIGSGYGGTVETIEIDGATIKENSGIGTGQNGTGGPITIKNATINTSLKNGTGSLNIQNSTVTNDGIESGSITIDNSSVNTGSAKITATESLSVTNNSFVIADSVSPKTSQADWNGIVGEKGNFTVYGNTTLKENITIEEGKKLTITTGSSLTVPAGITLTNKEKIDNQGTIKIEGTLDNYGDVPGKVEGTITENSKYTITKTGNCTDSVTFVSAVAANNKIFPDRDVVFSVNKKNYEVDVSYTVGNGEPQTLTEQNGVYTIPKAQITGNITLTINNRESSTVTAESTTWTPGIWKVPANTEVTILTTVKAEGSVTLVLEEGSVLTTKEGIHVGEGVTLIIQGTGTLNAECNNFNDDFREIGFPTAIGLKDSDKYVNGTIIINSGNINASTTKETCSGIGGSVAKVIINGGKITSSGSLYAYGIQGQSVVINGGTIEATSGKYRSAIGGESVTINNGTVTAQGLDNIESSGIDALNVKINSGTIIAKAGIKGSGIGGDNITITGGNITATGDSCHPETSGAGIGKSLNSTNQANILITGGKVTATAGRNDKADIDGTITISGGQVTAAGSGMIGEESGSFSTGTNGNAIINAKTIADQSKKTEWKGIISEDSGKTYTVHGDVTLGDNLEIKNNEKLVVPNGSSLKVPKDKTITNNGAIDIQSGGTLDFSKGGKLEGKAPDTSGGGTYIPDHPEVCTVTFNTNGYGTAPDAISVTYNTAAPVPAAPTEAGYTFGGWFKEAGCTTEWDFAQPVKNHMTLYAKWTPNTNTKYTVKHLQQNVADDGYTEKEIENLTGTTGKQTTAAAKTYEGFTAQAFTQKTIAADGSAVVEIKYDRKIYSITWKNGDTTLKTDTVRHGATPAYVGETPTKQADARYTYTFKEWSPAITPATGATTYTAEFTQTANQYTLTFDSKGGSAETEIKQDYDSAITLPTPTKAGYTFGGWYTDDNTFENVFNADKMPAANKTLYAKWNLAVPAVPVIQADPENGTAAYPSAVTLSAQFAEVQGLTYTYQWYKGETEAGTEKSLTLSTVAASGEYTVTVTVKDNTETKTSPKSAAKTVAISKGTITGTIAQKGTLTYNGAEQTAEINNTLTARGGQTVTVKFGNAADSCNADAVPGFTAAGTHKVYYKAVADNHEIKTGSFDVEIQQKEITVTVKDQNITYAEQPIIKTGINQISVDGLISGETLTAITLKANSDFTKVEASEPKIEKDQTDVTANYKITLTPGTLTRVHYWNAAIIYTWEQKDGSWICTAARSDINNVAVKEIVKAAVTGARTKTPTLTEKGETTYTATFTVDWAEQQTKIVADIPVLNPAETVEKVEQQPLEEVPDSLKDKYDTVEKIETAMAEVVLTKIGEQNTGNEQKTVIFDAALMIVENGVAHPATPEEVAAKGGITIVIPYPDGTNKTDYVFTVAHMVSVAMAGMQPGDIEVPAITLTDEGLQVTLKGFSPVMVGYSKKPVVSEPEAKPAPTEKPESFDWQSVRAAIAAAKAGAKVEANVESEIAVPHYIWQAFYGKNVTVTLVRGTDRYVFNGLDLERTGFNPDNGHNLTDLTAYIGRTYGSNVPAEDITDIEEPEDSKDTEDTKDKAETEEKTEETVKPEPTPEPTEQPEATSQPQESVDEAQTKPGTTHTALWVILGLAVAALAISVIVIAKKKKQQ